MKLIIDRFENELAVLELETGETVAVSKAIIPPDAKEGSILTISTDPEATDTRREAIKAKMNRLFH